MSDYPATICSGSSATIATIGDYGRATIRRCRLFAGDYRLLSDYCQRLSDTHAGVAPWAGLRPFSCPGAERDPAGRAGIAHIGHCGRWKHGGTPYIRTKTPLKSFLPHKTGKVSTKTKARQNALKWHLRAFVIIGVYRADGTAWKSWAGSRFNGSGRALAGLAIYGPGQKEKPPGLLQAAFMVIWCYCR